jgi:hypothetical protein
LKYNEEQAQAEQSQLEEKNRVNFALDAMNKYRDAGITLDDDYEAIQNKIQMSPTYQTQQAQETASLQRTTQLNNKGPAPTTSFTPTEKKKLEQAGLQDAPRQEQLDYLYGKDATNNAQFYIDRIKEGSVDYLNTDGTITKVGSGTEVENSPFTIPTGLDGYWSFTAQVLLNGVAAVDASSNIQVYADISGGALTPINGSINVSDITPNATDSTFIAYTGLMFTRLTAGDVIRLIHLEAGAFTFTSGSIQVAYKYEGDTLLT